MRRTVSICTLLALGLMVFTGCRTEEPEIAENKTVEPETVEPETVEPETVEPETVEPETVELETVTNSIGMKLKLIPAGEFTMGSSESPEELAKAIPGTKPEWFESQHPQHKLRITKPFYLGVTEVTQEQYEKVMGKNPSYFCKTGEGANKVKEIDTSNFPVENVSWEDAVEFCKKLSAKEGQTYRLPTEAEWEYACRAGSTTRYCFGDDRLQLGEYAWFAYEWVGPSSDLHSHSVGKKKPNAWGLHDMHGNVWEWCQDWYESDYYAESPTEDPPGPSTGSSRVYRGGGWYSDAWLCQSSYRFGFRPSLRNFSLGFRVARDPSASEPSSKPPAEAQSDSR